MMQKMKFILVGAGLAAIGVAAIGGIVCAIKKKHDITNMKNDVMKDIFDTNEESESTFAEPETVDSVIDDQFDHDEEVVVDQKIATDEPEATSTGDDNTKSPIDTTPVEDDTASADESASKEEPNDSDTIDITQMCQLCEEFEDIKDKSNVNMLVYLIPQATRDAIEKDPKTYSCETNQDIDDMYRMYLHDGFEFLCNEYEPTKDILTDWLSGKKKVVDFSDEEIDAICRGYYVISVPSDFIPSL